MEMMNNCYAYIEDYNYIKLIVNKEIVISSLRLQNIKTKEIFVLTPFQQEEYANEIHIHTHFKGKVILYNDYVCLINKNKQIPVSLGKITRSNRFEFENYFDGWLGYQYKNNAIIFRIWSPVAKEMYLMLNEQKHPMRYLRNGTWEIKINGDCEGFAYYYRFRINQKMIEATDPYGISTNSDALVNYVIDPNKTYKMKNGYRKYYKGYEYQQSIIYELNIRDFTIKLDVEHPGMFLGIIESKKIPNQGINYLTSLGITHVQLMPIWQFGGVEESIKKANEHGFKYNWGYNPLQLFTPSGWYTSNANSPYARINECKKLIDFLHENQLGVNIDVVFNHVYEANTFAMAKLVPGYLYLTDERGFLTDSSGCGNDLASEKKMVKKFIIDNLIFWQDFYQVDGFRFDLMGLIDLDTMQTAETVIKKKNPYAMVYGEGWNMHVNRPVEKRANMNNCWALPNVCFFNDQFRNFLKIPKGSINYFAIGEDYDVQKLYNLICGSSLNEYIFVNHNQSINYVECHDDDTFYDNLMKNKYTEDKALDYMKLALGIILISRGIPFLHSGVELMRTKKNIDNSYNQGDEINHFPWEKLDKAESLLTSVKDLIKIRSAYTCLLDTDNQPHIDIKGQLIYLSYNYHQIDEIRVIIKNDYYDETLYFAPNVVLIYNGDYIVHQKVSHLVVKKPGIYILKK